MIEEWKEIEGYTDYMVSNLGRVKSLNYRKTDKEQVLKPIKDSGGYLVVGLCKDRKLKQFKVHRLVANAFITNTDNKKEIDHINTIKTDNRVDNLRWVTHKENMNNPLTIKKVKGIDNYKAKPILQFDLNGNFIRKWDCAREVQRELGFDNGHISSCCRYERKTANGYKWKHFDIELYLESKLFKAFNIKNKLVA